MLERLKENHFLWFQGPMTLWGIDLFTQSSIPGDRIPAHWVFSFDKLIHFLIYMVFAWAVDRGITNQSRFPLLVKHHYLITFVIIAVYGASDEIHQYFVPKRSCSLLDWLADCFGAVVYLTYAWLRDRRRSLVALDATKADG